MTTAQLISYGRSSLLSAGIEEAEQDAWLLFSFMTGFDRTQYFLRRDADIDALWEERYRKMIDRRAKRVPVQYITNEAYFMGHTFYVDENVLIPRQDTEVLVERVCGLLNQGGTVLDMCTGSGCIILSLLLETGAAKGVASDISEGALSVAKKNAGLLSVENVEFVQGNLFENIHGIFDVIVSNPPYIETSALGKLMPEVVQYEPRTALDGYEDGLYFYRQITPGAVKYLKKDGYLCYEIGYNQGLQVSRLLEEAGFSRIQVIRDLAGLDRVVIGKKEIE